MSEPIKVGDLVMVMRPIPCCGNTCAVGYIFTVTEFGLGRNCIHCHAPIGDEDSACDGAFSYQVSRLKRIDPLTELKGTETDVSAPVQRNVRERIET